MLLRVESDDESNSNGSQWKVDDNRISLRRSLSGTPLPPALSYTFDHVFNQNCSNLRVYDLLTKDIINVVVDGFNGTAFAYGQTSSGKTFTMNGSENDPGIIHRAVNDIFAKIDMVIESKGKESTSNSDDAIRVTVFNLVDLAGSERIAKTGVGGVRLKEGKHINKSLYVHGMFSWSPS